MGGMSDDTRENVGLHCRLKVERVAKYHADEQDTTGAMQLNFGLGEQEEKRGTWAVDTKGHHGGHRRVRKGSTEEGLTSVLHKQHEKKGEGRTWAVDRRRHERTPRGASQEAQLKKRRRVDVF